MGTRHSLHLWAARFFYITPAISSGLTARCSATLLVSFSHHAFTLEALDGTRARRAAVLVPPHVPRRLGVDGCGLLSLNLDPVSDACRACRTASGQSFQAIDARRFGPLREKFDAALGAALDDSQLEVFSDRLVQAATGQSQPGAALLARLRVY